MAKTILVMGGTGRLGQPVSRRLQEAGFQVRIMTRNPERARNIFGNSFEVRVGDPVDAGCLDEALRGCFGVHISLPTDVEQQAAEAVAKVASRHGVERITYISGATVAEENRWFAMIDRKFLAERAIRDGGTPYTIFCPTWVMEGLGMFVNQGRASVLGKQPCPYHWVAADDIARMVCAAYGLEEAANKRFVVHGPEAIRMHEALRRYCAAYHPGIKEVSSIPLWLVKLVAAVTRNEELNGAGELMAYFENVGEGSNLPRANGVLDAPTTTLDRWLEMRIATTEVMDIVQ